MVNTGIYVVREMCAMLCVLPARVQLAKRVLGLT
jgi:hypothetical protein